MHILLPPSESKTTGGGGRSLRRRTGQGPLSEPRAEVIRALDDLLSRSRADIAHALALPTSVIDSAVRANAMLLDAPTRPALDRYAGVVYDGMRCAAWNAAERRCADRSVLIFSGLFGVVAGGAPVPDYRVPAKAVLPGVGTTGTYWRPWLAEHLPPLLRSGLVIDLRSSDYAAMWRPERSSSLARRVVRVRILSPRPDATMAVISFPSKFFKGVLADSIVRASAAGRPPATAEDLAALWSAAGGKDAVLSADKDGVVLELHSATSTVV
ncbi:peroxide stress protein YaaA [Jatrophihabitans telluris]|uniref:Peroxide stress protein YaaA n=1 Tax=Jatrophihabitans telluris TaxID=2038343 RepID=A0ABY4QS68_9ACTN|nr:peroxide stress protein YaaA [Jatrophihabitans telluris]UQX86726.1 peroxide stress protein YaaA [Jatrophihabitans telluris]